MMALRSTIDAAALQDHRVRSLGLRFQPPSRKRNPMTIPINSSSLIRRQKSRERCETSWSCPNCTLENSADTNDRCRACLQPHEKHLQRRTLAEKRGLIAKPTNQLSNQEWERCEQQAEERGDLRNPCAICREPLGAHLQIMLSCSHVYHCSCLASFERFLRASERVCPLCRKANYQKKLTNKGAAIYRELSAIRVQAFFRGFAARKKIWFEWKKFYASGKGESARRKNFFLRRLEVTTANLLENMQQQDRSIEQVLADCDHTMNLSRGVLRACTTIQDHDDLIVSGCAHRSANEVNWERILNKALSGEEDCAICLHSLQSGSCIAVLSCTHVFHEACIGGFEAVNIYELLLCPMCRGPYAKKIANRMVVTNSFNFSN